MFKKVRLADHLIMSNQAEFDKLIRKIASNIKKYRLKSGLTQQDMIEHGFNYRHYQRLESGKSGINLFTLYRLSKTFKIDLMKLIE